MSSVPFIRSYTQTSGAHIGDLLWWTLADAEVSRARLEAVWSGAGLSSTCLPEVPTPERALRTAIRECQVGQHSYLIRLGKQDESELVFAVVLENRDASGNVHHVQEARIVLDRNAPRQVASDYDGHDLVRAVSTAYDRLLNTHTADDVRRAILKTLASCAAVTLRDHGGVYWVPAIHAETLRRLQAAVGEIGASRLDVVPVHETPEATAALGGAARASIEEDLVGLRAEIEGFLAAPPRASTLVNRLQTFDDLRTKAQLYHSVLRVQVEDLEASLSKLTLQVEGLLQTRAA
jgi:hypothetical protein